MYYCITYQKEFDYCNIRTLGKNCRIRIYKVTGYAAWYDGVFPARKYIVKYVLVLNGN